MKNGNTHSLLGIEISSESSASRRGRRSPLRTATSFFPFALFLLAGCSGVIVVPVPDVPPLPGVPDYVDTSVAQYRAYGDSITAGATLSNPAVQDFPAWVAVIEDLPLANNARYGDQACDVPTAQIFAHADSPTLAAHPVYTVLIGTNDVEVKGAGAYESVFMLCHQATIAWLAVPAEYKVLANGSGIATTGPGLLDTSNHWNAWTTQGPGASVSFTINTAAAAPIYVWPRIRDGSSATYTYSLDAVVMGERSVGTTPRIATQNGGTDSLGFIRLPSTPAGKHVVQFTQTSAGTDGVSIVGVGSPAGPASNPLPTVLVGTIPYELRGGSGPCSRSDTPCQQYIKDIQADIELFAADGLNVRVFDTRKYMFGSAAEMNDALHPNVYGQYELSHSVEASWH